MASLINLENSWDAVWPDLWGDRSRGRKSLKVEIGDSLELMYNGTRQFQSYLSFQICTYNLYIQKYKYLYIEHYI